MKKEFFVIDYSAISEEDAAKDVLMISFALS